MNFRIYSVLIIFILFLSCNSNNEKILKFEVKTSNPGWIRFGHPRILTKSDSIINIYTNKLFRNDKDYLKYSLRTEWHDKKEIEITLSIFRFENKKIYKTIDSNLEQVIVQNEPRMEFKQGVIVDLKEFLFFDKDDKYSNNLKLIFSFDDHNVFYDYYRKSKKIKEFKNYYPLYHSINSLDTAFFNHKYQDSLYTISIDSRMYKNFSKLSQVLIRKETYSFEHGLTNYCLLLPTEKEGSLVKLVELKRIFD